MEVNDWEKATLLRALRGEPLVTNNAEKNALRILVTKVDILPTVNPNALEEANERYGIYHKTGKLPPASKHAGSLLHGDWEPG